MTNGCNVWARFAVTSRMRIMEKLATDTHLVAWRAAL